MNNDLITNNNTGYVDENGMPVNTQYVDELGNPIDASLIDESGNYIGTNQTQYVDEFGNPIDPTLVDEFGNYIGNSQGYVDELGNAVTNNPSVQSGTINQSSVANALNMVSGNGDMETIENVTTAPISSSEHQMDDKEFLTGMVTFDYNNVPITDIVNSIILDAINKGASDIHFDPFDDGIKIRIRIDGQLNDYSIVPLFVKKNMITRIKIISGMNITESRTPQDGAIRTELANKSVDLRVSCLPTNMGEKIVIRIMDYSMSAAGIEALDFDENNLKKVQKMLSLPNGIILVTGATGSGKSTTVYSMLQRLNVEGTNLLTVEDPIEMNIGGVNQVQAIPEIGLDFATVLRSILRQDPDVIMIGEIRDDETARIAIRASITGHLVLSTIHTNNSLNTIERLTDMNVERYLLGTALSGIISQKLARRLCEKCKTLRPTNEYEKEVFKKALGKDIEEIYTPVGCPYCSRGYRGRIAIQEVLLLNQNIQDAITKGMPKSELRKLVYGHSGTETMLEDGLNKVLEGKTSFDEILKLIDLEDDLGSGSQLGLDDQLEDAERNNETTNNTNNQPINLGNNPININITPELLASLTSIGNQIQNIKESNQNINSNENIPVLDDTPALEDIDKTKEEIIELPEEKNIEEPIIKDDEDLPVLNEEIEGLEDNNEDVLEILPQDEQIEELDTNEEPTIIEPNLYDELIKTKENINKRNFKKQVIDILDKMSVDENITSSPVPQDILSFIKDIKETDALSLNKKKEIINKFNEVFNLNEEIEEENDIPKLIEEDDKQTDENIIDDELQDIDFDEIDEDLDFDIDSLLDKDLDKIINDENLIIDEDTGFNFHENPDNDTDVILQDDYQIDNSDLVIDENSFDNLDIETIESLLKDMEDNEDKEDD